jgi:small subunit ribosomal protein S9
MATAKEKNTLQAVGRRKCAVARVRITPGSGKVLINDRDIDDYFGRATSKMILRQPLDLTETTSRYDVHATVAGGGLSGQADAIQHGIARALLLLSPNFRPALKKAGYLTRDSRIKERKKYGQRGARARYQYSKR